MSLDLAIQHLRSLNEAVPQPLRLPSASEIAAMEASLGIEFHPDYRRYLLEASDVVFGVKEPATITRSEAHTHLLRICTRAWAAGVPKELLPFCEDNGDYHCMSRDGRVLFLSHNGWNSQTWPDLAAWIEQVWIGESDLGE